MSGEHDSGPSGVEACEYPHDIAGHLSIQIPCGFVCQKEGRIIDQSPSNGHPLSVLPQKE